MIALLAKISYWLTIIPPAWTAISDAIKAVDTFITAWKNYK